MGNIQFNDSTLVSVKSHSPMISRRLKMSPLVEGIHHRKMERKPMISYARLVTNEGCGWIPLPFFPPRLYRLDAHLMDQMIWKGK